MTLVAYLAGLNSTETQWSIFVNPGNPDEYTCSQWDGPDGWVKIGSPESLSYGFQSVYEAVKSFLEGCGDSFEFNGRKVRFSLKGLLEAYSERNIAGNDALWGWLESEAADIMAEWSQNEAELFVADQLPGILSQAKADVEMYAEAYA
jgi:hypothetical protein